MVSYPGQINGNLSVTGNLTVTGNATVTGDAIVGDDLTVTDALSVGGISTLTGAATITAGTLNLGADVNLYRDGANNLRTDDHFHMPTGQSDGDFNGFAGDAKALAAGTAGGGLAVKEGSNARSGTLVLTGATPVVVANSSVTATTRIQLTTNVPGGTPAHFWVSARSAGVSFSVTGTAGDTSTLAYLLVEPA